MSFDLETEYFDFSMSESGVWLDFYNGSKLKLSSIDNKKYKATLARLGKRYRLQLDSSNEDSFELVNKITCEALASHILMDWSGIMINGKEVEYSPKIGQDALMKSQKLRDFVQEQAALAANFQPSDETETDSESEKKAA